LTLPVRRRMLAMCPTRPLNAERMDDLHDEQRRPAPIIAGIRLFTTDGGKDDWKARQEALTQKVRQEAKGRYERGGMEELRRLHDALGDGIQKKIRTRGQWSKQRAVFRIIARASERRDSTQRVVEDLHDGDDWPELVLQPNGTAGFVLDLTDEIQEAHGLPTDLLLFREIGVQEATTWGDVETEARERIEQLNDVWKRADRKVAYLQFRQDVIRELLERDEYGLPMPWHEPESGTGEGS